VRIRAWLAPIELARLERGLRPATVAFLGAPVLLWTATWLRPTLALAATAAALLALRPLARGGPPSETSVCVRPLALLAGLAPAVALVLTSGAGGLVPRNWDWLKHDAVLKDLVTQPWPVLYATDGATAGLVYYVAYLLPAGAVGVAAGWQAANVVVAATSLAGAVLAVLWLVVLARGAPLLCGAAFALYSGMDALGAVLLSGRRGIAAIGTDYFLENWSGLWQYSCTPSLLNFVPNQAIAGWLLTALLVDAARRGRIDLPVAALPAIALLWSPFVALGLLPLLAAWALATGRPAAALARAQASAANLAAVVLGGPLVAYYATHFAPLALPDRFRQAGAAAAAGDFWLVPARVAAVDFGVRYLLFVSCEFLLLSLLVLHAQRAAGGDRPMRLLVLGATGSLLALPLFHYGIYNDLVMRASIPALFLLLAASLRALCSRPGRAASAGLVAVLAVGAVYPANLARWHLLGAARAPRRQALRPAADVATLFQLQLHDPLARRLEFVSQYLGSTDTPFYRRLARRSAAVTVAEDDLGHGR